MKLIVFVVALAASAPALAQELTVAPCSNAVTALFAADGHTILSCRSATIRSEREFAVLDGAVENSAASRQRLLILVEDQVLFDTGVWRGDRRFPLGPTPVRGCRLELVAVEAGPPQWRPLRLRRRRVWLEPAQRAEGSADGPEQLRFVADFDDLNRNDAFDARFDMTGRLTDRACAREVS